MNTWILLYPVENIDASLPLFVDGLKLKVEFRSGGRYCLQKRQVDTVTP